MYTNCETFSQLESTFCVRNQNSVIELQQLKFWVTHQQESSQLSYFSQPLMTSTLLYHLTIDQIYIHKIIKSQMAKNQDNTKTFHQKGIRCLILTTAVPDAPPYLFHFASPLMSPALPEVIFTNLETIFNPQLHHALRVVRHRSYHGPAKCQQGGGQNCPHCGKTYNKQQRRHQKHNEFGPQASSQGDLQRPGKTLPGLPICDEFRCLCCCASGTFENNEERSTYLAYVCDQERFGEKVECGHILRESV